MSIPKDPIAGGPTAGDLTGARVSVAAQSRTQVALVRDHRHLACDVRAVRDTGLELVGPVFYPKGCQLEIELSRHGRAPIRDLRGVVRGVRMAGPEPAYTIALQLEQSAVAALGQLKNAFEGRTEAKSSGDLGALGSSSVPSWALLLVGQGLMSEAELHRIAGGARTRRLALEDALVRDGAVAPEAVAACMALDMSVVYVDPRGYDIRMSNRELIPEQLARHHGMFPLFRTGDVITLGMKDPTDLALVDQVRLRANSQVDPCLCPPGTIESLIDRHYRAGPAEPKRSQLPKPRQPEPEVQNDNAIVRLVHSVVADSSRSGASDVHIEPERDYLRVRIRVDGILHETATHSLDMHAPIVSRIKVQSKLDIAETRRPQDGHFTATVDGATVDVRVSTIPTVHGENVVLRLLMSDGESIRLDRLGMPSEVLARFRRFLDQPNGMVLVTGPTGSGKTSTLYAALERLNTMDRNIVTVEDPVEKRVPLLRQTEVNSKAGITFASGLRSILRQDPDVIMVGEIRDKETAEIAVQAALTGHLVLSTLHTNTAAGAIVRLNEMGVTPFLLTSSLRAVIGQRLARRVCRSCAREVEPDPRLVAGLGMQDAQQVTFMAGSGCADCLHTGYKGRIGIYEILEISGDLGRVLLGGASREQIEREAESALCSSLREDGLRKVREGTTTLEEVVRIVGLAEPDSAALEA